MNFISDSMQIFADPESVTEAIQVCSHTSVTVSAVVRALYHNNQEYERLGINDERYMYGMMLFTLTKTPFSKASICDF